MQEKLVTNTSDQNIAPLDSVETETMESTVDYEISLDAESIYDVESVGLQDSEDGTSFKVIADIGMGVVKIPETGTENGATVFIVEATSNIGTKEIGLMGVEIDENGNKTANGHWQSIPRGSDDKIILGRHSNAKPKNTGETSHKVDIDTLFDSREYDKEVYSTVSRQQLSICNNYTENKIVIRDLGLEGNTDITRRKLPTEALIASKGAELKQVGELAVNQVLITEIPPSVMPSTVAPEVVRVLSAHEQETIQKRVDELNAEIASDSKLTEVATALRRKKEILEDKKDNWNESRKPGADASYHGEQSHMLQQWEADADKDLGRLKANGQLDAFNNHPAVAEHKALLEKLRTK